MIFMVLISVVFDLSRFITLFSSPLVLLSNPNLHGFCIHGVFCVPTITPQIKECLKKKQNTWEASLWSFEWLEILDLKIRHFYFSCLLQGWFWDVHNQTFSRTFQFWFCWSYKIIFIRYSMSNKHFFNFMPFGKSTCI